MSDIRVGWTKRVEQRPVACAHGWVRPNGKCFHCDAPGPFAPAGPHPRVGEPVKSPTWTGERQANDPVTSYGCDCHLHERQVCDVCQGTLSADEGAEA